MSLLCKILLGFAACLTALDCGAQQTLRVMEYNVENLFDCRHDTLKHDSEYLPHATRGWNWKRYHEKLNRIAKVILAASGEQVPDLVGLCEVENAYCLDGLVKYSPLRDAAYRYVMTDSPDERGIDVALLYQPSSFRLIAEQHIRIPSHELKRKPTRDILHVAGRVLSGDTLDVFVCHMPSRSGGEKLSEPYRLFTARILRHAADSVMKIRRTPYLIILGDFNDYPESRSICQTLGAGKPGKEIHSLNLYNLMNGKLGGTYRYRGEWGILDQLILNGTFLKQQGNLTTSYDRARILTFPFLLEEDENYGGEKPFRTYNGMKYHGGYSDHLPVCLDIELKCPAP